MLDRHLVLDLRVLLDLPGLLAHRDLRAMLDRHLVLDLRVLLDLPGLLDRHTNLLLLHPDQEKEVVSSTKPPWHHIKYLKM
jgi:hypothetical protein